MTRQLSRTIALGCTALLISVPVFALYYLLNIEEFAEIARNNITLPIQWQTVSVMQWYTLWLLTATYISIGLIGLVFLRRAFTNFAQGQLFSYSNSRNLRQFSAFLLIQVLAKVLLLILSSVLLSMNHPAGEKIFAVQFGSGEIKMIAVALIMWVVSDLLIKGSRLESENKQFI